MSPLQNKVLTRISTSVWANKCRAKTSAFHRLFAPCSVSPLPWFCSIVFVHCLLWPRLGVVRSLIYVYIYIYIYTYIHTYIHIYIYREREGERYITYIYIYMYSVCCCFAFCLHDAFLHTVTYMIYDIHYTNYARYVALRYFTLHLNHISSRSTWHHTTCHTHDRLIGTPSVLEKALSLSLSIHICIYIYMYMCIRTHTYVYVCITYIYIYIYIRLRLGAEGVEESGRRSLLVPHDELRHASTGGPTAESFCIYMYIYIYIYTYTPMYNICIDTCIHIYVYIYIYIYISVIRLAFSSWHGEVFSPPAVLLHPALSPARARPRSYPKRFLMEMFRGPLLGAPSL